MDSAKLLAARICAHPAGAPAIEHGPRTVTYGQLAQLIADRAEVLGAHGGRGAFVAIQRPKSVEYLVDLLAVFALGGTAVPLDPDLPKDRLNTFLELARPAVLADESGLTAIEGPRWPGVPGDGAFVFFTSGSTGLPKPVLGSAAAVTSFVDWFCPEFGFGAGDRFAFLTGVSFEASLRDIFPPLVYGATVVLPEAGTGLPPEEAVRWLADRRISVVTAVPSVARAWLRHRTGECESVRAAFFVGEPVAGDVLEDWRAAFPNTAVRVNSYGSTESGQATIYRRVAPGEEPNGLFPAGRPVPGTQYCFIDPQAPLSAELVRTSLERPCPEGEIVIVSRACSHGYLGLPAEHAARFADLGDGVKAYRTGDLGRVDGDGDLLVVGRADDEVKINGVRVHPAEVTRALRAHPAVADVFVAAARLPDGARLTAYWVPAGGSSNGVDLRRDLLETLPLPFIPSRFVALDRLPRTRTGKVDRAALIAQAGADAAAEEFAAPAGEVEQRLAGMLTDLLDAQAVSATADLFALGADSLAVTSLAARVLEEFGIGLSQKDIFGAATLRGLAELIGQRPARAMAIPVLDRSGGRLPMSPAQRRHYFLQKLHPESPAYNNVEAVSVPGPLSLDRVRAAVAAVVRRHEVLRTRCAIVDGEPVLVPDDTVLQSLVVEQARVERFAELVERPFDLDAEPPLRVYAADEAILFVVHHIASDAWSCRLLVREFFEAYAGGELPVLEVQYADLAAIGEAGDIGYWRRRLDGMPPLIELPMEHPRPALRDDRGAEFHMRLDAEGLRRTARAAGVTPFAVLLTAFGYVLHRHCATRDVVVGTPVSGRGRVEAEQVIGCFINTVVLRLDLSDAPTRRELVRRLWASTLADVEHADVPFERLVAELGHERDLGAGQLVQVMFNHYPATEVTGAVPLAVPRHRAKFDLTCTAVEGADGITVTWNYATGLLERELVDRMGEHFRSVLDALGDLDAPMATLPSGGEPDGEPPSFALGPSALQRFERWVHECPDRTAVRCLDRTLTYGELDRWAGRVANWLATADPGPVVLLMERSVEYIVAILAALKAGRTYVPLDVAMPAAHVETVRRAAGATLVLTRLEGSDGSDGRATPADPDDPMYVLFTSGSTGEPKGVVVEHRHFTAYLTSLLERMAPPEGMHFALVSTLAADLGLTNVYGALCTGGTLHVLPYEWATDPDLLAGYFRRHRIDFMKLVPSHLAAIAEAGLLEAVVPQRFLVLAGEACPWELVAAARAARPGCAVWNHYGPTETTVSVLAYEIPASPCGPTVPLGHPLGHAGVRIVDDQLRPVPRGAAGELLITGGSVARGYLGGEGFEGSYRSGDRVRRRADGAIEFLGRIDRQIKVRGYRVEPGHIEAVLRRHPGVTDVAVEASPALVAYHCGGDTASLARYAREALPPYMVPSAFVALERFPLTPNGKLDRRALPVPTPAVDGQRTPPRDGRDAELVRIWCEVLGVESVGIDDDFFALGGDSFAAMRLARRIGGGMRVVSVFQHPTVRRLADFLRQDANADGYLHRLSDAPPGAVTASVVAVPFGGGTAAAYAELARALPAGFPLYAIELPGHDPASPAGELEPFAVTASRCVDEILGTVKGPIVVYGHCVGAALAFDIARRLQDAGAEVAGVVAGGAFPAPRLPGRIFNLWARVFPSDRWRADRLYRDMLRAIGGISDELTGQELAAGLRALRHDSRQSEELYTALCHDPALRRTLPALCVVGERDRITEFHQERHREWNLLCADTDLSVIPDAGHYFLRHQPAALARSIVDWVRARTAKAVVPQAPPARNIRGFALVTLGQLVSLVGARALAFALGIWVYLQTGSVTQFSLILVTALLPGLLVLPFAGAAADRWNRRLLMVAGEVANAAGAVLCLVALGTGTLQMWHVYVAASLGSVAASLQQPAYLAAVAQLVPKQYLARTNGMLQAVVAVGQIAGPFAGGALIALAGLGAVIWLDLGTVLFALSTLAVVRFPDLMFRRREESLWAEIGGGLRYLARRPPMVAMVGFFLCYNLILGFALALTPAMVLSFAGGGTLSVVTMVGAAGGVAGGLVMAVWGGTARRATGMVGFVALTGLGMIIIGARAEPLYPVAGLAVVMASIALINGHWQTMIQVKVGQELQGRILATNRMTANLTEPLGYLGAGWLADAVFEPAVAQPGRGMALMLTILGVALLGLAVAGLRWRTLHHMEDALPDAVPGAVVTWDRDRLQNEADHALAARTTTG